MVEAMGKKIRAGALGTLDRIAKSEFRDLCQAEKYYLLAEAWGEKGKEAKSSELAKRAASELLLKEKMAGMYLKTSGWRKKITVAGIFKRFGLRSEELLGWTGGIPGEEQGGDLRTLAWRAAPRFKHGIGAYESVIFPPHRKDVGAVRCYVELEGIFITTIYLVWKQGGQMRCARLHQSIQEKEPASLEGVEWGGKGITVKIKTDVGAKCLFVESEALYAPLMIKEVGLDG